MNASLPSGGIAAWLRAIGLAKYEPLFRAHAIDLDLLSDLEDKDLKEIAIPLGDRKRILAALARQKVGTPPGRVAAPSDRDAIGANGAERRQITIMFCDLVESTKLASELDPEDLAHVLRAYRHCCAELIGRWNGYVARYLGDGVVAYFGWPHAQEDDAERAVRAGLELTVAVGRLHAGGETGALMARVGIATGLVLIGELIGEGFAQEETVIGTIPNLAFRLQAVAAPASVVIPTSTHRLIAGRFDCASLGQHQLKGFRDAIELWRVDRVASTTRFGVRLAQRLTPFVGRKREKKALLDMWSRAEQGHGQAALIVGEAGVGKSRLARVFAERLSGTAHAMPYWQCSSLHSNSALHPFIEHMYRVAGIAVDDAPALKRLKAEALWAESGQDAQEAASALAAILAVPARDGAPQPVPSLQHQHLLTAVAQFIRGGARERPLLLTVEDIQWADPTTIELMRQVIAASGGERIMVLLTARAGVNMDWAAKSGVTTITLRGLTRQTTHHMLGQMTDGKTLPKKLADAIVSTADGIPLFVEELTRSVLESGRVQETAEGFELSKPGRELAVPPTLRDSLTARLDRLSVDKEIAQVAASIGRTFSPRLMSLVLQRPEAALGDAFAQLVDAGILEQRGAATARRYVFRHALIQEVAYQSQLNARRREIHWRIGRAIESQFPEEALAFPENMARHFTEADVPEIAARYELEAGRKALHLSASREAIAHMKKGLELVAQLPQSPASDALKLRLNASLGSAFMLAKSWAAPEAEAAYRAATGLIHAAADPAEAIWILWGSWVHHQARGNIVEADAVRGQLRMAAKRKGDATSRLIVDMISLQVSFYAGRFAESIRYCRAVDGGFREADGGALTGLYTIDLRLVSAVHGAIAWWVRGAADKAAALVADAERLARAIGHPHSLAWTLTWGAMVHLLAGDVDVLAARLDEGVALAGEHGFPYVIAIGSIMKGWALAQRGSLSQGIADMQQSLIAFQATGASIAVPHFLTLIAELLADAGRSEEALALARQAEMRVERWGERWQLSEVYRVMAKSIAIGGVPSQAAETLFARAIEVAEMQGARGWALRAQASRARHLSCLQESAGPAGSKAPAGHCMQKERGE